MAGGHVIFTDCVQCLEVSTRVLDMCTRQQGNYAAAYEQKEQTVAQCFACGEIAHSSDQSEAVTDDLRPAAADA